jgi:hypothetical protein
MSENLHHRAKQLFDESLVERVSSADQSWLDAHLRDCAECSREIARTQQLLRSFRNVSVTIPWDLAARAQLRVRLRAQESAQSSPTSALLWVMTAASWVLGILSAPLVWRVFAWFGSQLNLPKPVLEFGFVLWWTVPALIAVAVILHQRSSSHGLAKRTDA